MPSCNILGPMGKDGNPCPQFCPVKCGMDDVWCPGNMDDNGCMMPEVCMPKGSGCPNAP